MSPRRREADRSLIQTVVTQVSQRVPLDGREARSRHRALVALGHLQQPFDQRADPTHVTGSALIEGPRGILLLRHKRLGILVQPGGHIEPGESPWEAARREAEEETGLELRFVGGRASRPPGAAVALAHLDVHDGGRGHTHLDLRYVLEPVGGEIPRPPVGESQDVRWFDWADAVALADRGLVGLLAGYQPR